MPTLVQKLKMYQTATYNLAQDAADYAETEHWSHYNGAFTALLVCLDSGIPVSEEIVQAWADVFAAFEIDPADYQDEEE